MSEALMPLIVAAASVLIAAMLCGAALIAWRGWLNLKRLELTGGARPPAEADEPAGDEGATGTRIELAAVKERLRRLEAIANGVEL